MGDLGAVGGQRLVVEAAGRLRIQRQVELVLPAELEARLAQRVVAQLRTRVTLRQIRRVRRDLVGDDAVLHVIAIGQAQVLLGGDVAQHGGAVPADHGGADGAGDVVVSRGNVGGQRSERVERRLVTHLQLPVHVLLDEVQGNVPGPLDHHLHVVVPRDLRQLAQRLQLGELGIVIGVRDGSGPESVAEREADVVAGEDLAHLLEVRVEEVLLVVRHTPLGQHGAAPRYDPSDALRRERHVAQQDAGVHREVVHALLRLFDQRVPEHLPRQVLGHPIHLLQRLVDRHGADRHRRVADDPLSGLVDVVTRAQIHHRVGAPPGRPAHLLDLLLDAAADGGVADVGVDLHQEVAADDHRFGLGVIDVRRDDRPASCHL